LDMPRENCNPRDHHKRKHQDTNYAVHSSSTLEMSERHSCGYSRARDFTKQRNGFYKQEVLSEFEAKRGPPKWHCEL
jgi:hypothetical protein